MHLFQIVKTFSGQLFGASRAWAGFQPTRALVSAVQVDHSWTQLEHGETCSTAEATRGHYACVHAVLGGLTLADPGITAEP